MASPGNGNGNGNGTDASSPPSDDRHHHHVSISALRNKFETLAQDTREYVSRSRPVSPRPPVAPPVDTQAAETHSAPASIYPSPAETPAVESVAPTDESEGIASPGPGTNAPKAAKVKPTPPPKPALRLQATPSRETVVVPSTGEVQAVPSAAPGSRIPPPRPPKPSSSTLSAPARLSPNEQIISPTPIYQTYSRPRSPLCQPSSPPRLMASPEPGPTLELEEPRISTPVPAPLDTAAAPAPAVATASAPVPAPAPPPAPALISDEPEAPQSFAAIRDRFAKGGPAATPSSAPATLPLSVPGEGPGSKNSSARASPALSVHVQSPTLLSPVAKKPEKPPPPSHPPSSYVPPPSAYAPPPVPHESRPRDTASDAPTTAKTEKVPPPPPISRSASPRGLVPEGQCLAASPVQAPYRAESPIEMEEPQPLPQAHRPPPPPPKKSTSATSTAPVVQGDVPPPAQPKPPLPVRRPTGSGDGQLPPPLPKRSNTMGPLPDLPGDANVAKPPLPGNKPLAPTPKAVPDPGPQRPRSSTVAGGRPAGAPPLPARQNTLSASPAPSPAPVGRSRASSSAEHGVLPPPPQRSDTSSASLHRSSTVSSGRSAPRRDTMSTPQRSGNAMYGGDSDDDDDSFATSAPGLTSLAQRLLEEHPDGSQANRRPPEFSPDIKIHASHSITAFTVYSRFVVCAHHHVKVYDTLMPESPVLDFDPKHMGLDSKVKEPRVTSLCFRPSTNGKHEGRYLWCGNRDGHIWELDISSGEVTATHPGVHSAAVTHIMRSGRNMITLDEFGKLNMFEVKQTSGPDDEGDVKLFRSLRITEKPTFVKMIKGKLWAATAPAVRSTTNSATARGPTVRVWDVNYPGTAPPPLMALTTEWTGSATSATVMPFDPEITYIGHEGGFVSLWAIQDKQLHCLRVLKVSSTDILSLEGVGERLWAGNRRGEIHAWKLDEMPWTTTNIWNAHPDQPVHTIVVDPYSIQATGRFMAWSCSRDSLAAWDGLLAVDWIDAQMAARQPEYCEFRDVRILVCTWNIDSAKPSDLTGSVNSSFLPELLSSCDSPDLIVFGFQEVIPLTDKKLTAKTLLFGKGGSDRVSSVYQAWADKLSLSLRQTSSEPYVKVHHEQLVGLFAALFVKASARDSLRDVSLTAVKRGIGGMYGNKGALVARVVMDDSSLCFINVHLAAGQKHKAARNADLAAIMDDKSVFPPADKLPYIHGGDGSGILDHEFVILNGDLNYRIDQRRDVVVNAVSRGDLAPLLAHDQLLKEMKSNHAFRLRHFEEAPITFPPTYKYDPGTDMYDSSEKRRIPAWCDRILFTRSPRIKALEYRRYEPTVSDHKPVSAVLQVSVKRIVPARRNAVRKEVHEEWTRREDDLLGRMARAYATLY